MMLAAEYIPSPLRLMLGRHCGTRESGIAFFFAGKRGGIPVKRGGNPRFPIWPGNRESPFPDLAGKQGTPVSIRPGPGIGVPIRRAGDFLVCVTEVLR